MKKAAPPAPPAPRWRTYVSAVVAYMRTVLNTVVRPAFDLRTLVLAAIAVALLVDDTVVAESFRLPLGIVTFTLAMLHLFRKVVAPKVDRQALAAVAQTDPNAAASIYRSEILRDISIMFFVLFAAIR